MRSIAWMATLSYFSMSSFTIPKDLLLRVAMSSELCKYGMNIWGLFTQFVSSNLDKCMKLNRQLIIWYEEMRTTLRRDGIDTIVDRNYTT